MGSAQADLSMILVLVQAPSEGATLAGNHKHHAYREISRPPLNETQVTSFLHCGRSWGVVVTPYHMCVLKGRRS